MIDIQETRIGQEPSPSVHVNVSGTHPFSKHRETEEVLHQCHHDE
jgi:hypothetical protein